MKKSCNRCRAFCVNEHGHQGCGLGFRTKLIVGVASATPMCHVVNIAPDEVCTPAKKISDSIDMNVSPFNVIRWWTLVDVERWNKNMLK